MRYIAIIVCFVFFWGPVYSEKKDSMTFPVIAYSDSFGLMYGVYHLRYLPESDATQRIGVILSDGGYKATLGFKGVSFIPGWSLDGAFGFEDWFHNYYGLGNSTNLEDQIELSTKEVDVYLKLKRSISEHQSLGVSLISKTREEQVEKNEGIRYFRDQSLFGFGFGYTLDTRDARINSESGYLVRPEFSRIGNYTKYDLDMRYFQPFGEAVIAWRALAGRVVGVDVPFLLKYRLSTNAVLRGASGDRYNGDALISFQMEYRRHVWKMLYGTFFIESAQVGPVIAADDMHVSYGLGIHFKFGEGRQRMRVDYGVTRNNDKNMTVGFNSAF